MDWVDNGVHYYEWFSGTGSTELVSTNIVEVGYDYYYEVTSKSDKKIVVSMGGQLFELSSVGAKCKVPLQEMRGISVFSLAEVIMPRIS